MIMDLKIRICTAKNDIHQLHTSHLLQLTWKIGKIRWSKKILSEKVTNLCLAQLLHLSLPYYGQMHAVIREKKITSKEIYLIQSNLWIKTTQGKDMVFIDKCSLFGGFFVLFYQRRVIEMWPLFTGWPLIQVWLCFLTIDTNLFVWKVCNAFIINPYPARTETD